MNKLLLVPICAFGIALIHANPQNKGDYLDHLTYQLQEKLCDDNSSTIEICEVLSPVTEPVIKGLLNVYTESPKNYLLFTLYRTDLPCYEIRGVGVGGKFFVWSWQTTGSKDQMDSISTCFNFIRG